MKQISKNIEEILNSEKGVSEVVDFMIILGIMLIAISIITLFGLPTLTDIQDNGHTENIKQSHIVLSDNINKIVFSNAPSQSVELKMYGGGVWVMGDSSMNVTVQTWNSSNNSLENESFTRQLREIRSEFETTVISYENTGAWARYDNRGTVMIKEPMFTFSNNVMFIPAVTFPGGTKGLSGEGLIRVVADGGTPSLFSYSNVSAVDIKIVSNYYEGWEKYLNESFDMYLVSKDDTNTTILMRNDNFSENIDVHIKYSPITATVE
ncbi:hypothetical protein J2755_001978 [Methanohalophilus levihalophilus]|uniref:DUF7289 family protein n=1 Tax=Methanohalophilus levihalophilus TaxID=1431282 RepID=UPI001AE1C1B2|nr:hypothetical protein [Methanohalophilus levihalophilus]MBP2031030.1 hypothetical protein [Methanohalophilus levihalophilus]